MSVLASKADQTERPWLKSYPEHIDWDNNIDLTPVHLRVMEACGLYANRPALDFMGKVTSYKKLGHEITALAGALQQDLGIKKGDRVAILLPNCPYYPIAYYAILYIGATVVNCNPLYAYGELEHIIKNSDAKTLITTDLALTFNNAQKLKKNGHIESVVVGNFAKTLPLIKSVLYKLVNSKDLAENIDFSPHSGFYNFGNLVNRNIKHTPIEIDPHNDVAVQQYTGGTTGIPKGAMLSHSNIAANKSQIDIWALDLFSPQAKLLSILPFFHVFAMTVCLNIPLTSGTLVVMLPKFEIKSFLSTLKRTKATILPTVPTLLAALASNPLANEQNLSPIKVAISGGAGLPNKIRDAFGLKSSALLAEGYGLTEASPVLCCAPLRIPSPRNSIGLPLPNTEIKFVSLEDPNILVKHGEHGELVAKGPQIMLGYFNDDKANTDVFTSDGFLRTADVGHFDENGFVYIVDRLKDLIICSGFNIYPRVIEDAIYRHPNISEACVVGVSDEYRGEAPVAFIKLKPNKQLTAAELASFLKEHLSKIEQPREYIFRDELPKTLVGKHSRKILRDEYNAAKAIKS